MYILEKHMKKANYQQGRESERKLELKPWEKKR